MEGSLIGRSLVIVARPVVSGGNAVFGRALTLPPRGRERPVKGNYSETKKCKMQSCRGMVDYLRGYKVI